jgi:serine/threonine protein kinase
MHYLHSKDPKILHLDLKPANILVFRDYAVKISDLGLAEVVEKGDGIPSEYYKGAIPYAAPEAIAAARRRSVGEEAPRLTTKADVFSFGVLLYQMVLAGKVKTPFSAEMGELAAAYPSHDVRHTPLPATATQHPHARMLLAAAV